MCEAEEGPSVPARTGEPGVLLRSSHTYPGTRARRSSEPSAGGEDTRDGSEGPGRPRVSSVTGARLSAPRFLGRLQHRCGSPYLSVPY